jgi:RNA polymerase sigma-70 factor, ECF subfamily
LAAVPSTGRASGVESPAAREAEATRDLYERYAGQIFRYCLRQLGSREEAEDAVQSTFLNAFRGLKRGVVLEAEAAWLFKIAHNVCLSRRRSTWRRGRVESPADFAVVEEVAAAPSRRGDELIGLQDVLERMPENQRRAILLREWQGLSYREIASELELSQGAVETLIFRARRSLAQGLEEPPEQQRRRIRRTADLGSLAAFAKSLLVGGSAAVKVAATVAVLSATTVVATAPVEQHLRHQHAAPPVAKAPPKPHTAVAQSAAGSASASPTSAAPAWPARRHRAAVTGAPGPHAVLAPTSSPAPPTAPQQPAAPAGPAAATAPQPTPAAPSVPPPPAAPRPVTDAKPVETTTAPVVSTVTVVSQTAGTNTVASPTTAPSPMPLQMKKVDPTPVSLPPTQVDGGSGDSGTTGGGQTDDSGSGTAPSTVSPSPVVTVKVTVKPVAPTLASPSLGQG